MSPINISENILFTSQTKKVNHKQLTKNKENPSKSQKLKRVACSNEDLRKAVTIGLWIAIPNVTSAHGSKHPGNSGRRIKTSEPISWKAKHSGRRQRDERRLSLSGRRQGQETELVPPTRCCHAHSAHACPPPQDVNWLDCSAKKKKRENKKRKIGKRKNP